MATKLSLKRGDLSQIPMFTPDSDWLPPQGLPDLRQEALVAIDTETRDPGLAAGYGPAWHTSGGYVAGVGVAWAGGQTYIPLSHPDSQCFDRGQVASWLKSLLGQSNTRFVFHNAGYDLGWLGHDFGVKPPAHIDDTGAMAAMIDENRRGTSAYPKPYSLDALCAWRGVPGKDETMLREAAAAFGFPTAVKENLWRLPARFVGPYGEGDPASTLALYQSLLPEIQRQGLVAAYQLEADLIPLTLEMRRRGIRVDTARAEQVAQLFDKRRDEALAELTSKLGHQTTIKDVRSPGWKVAAFDSQGVGYPRTPPTDAHENGQPSFESDWMRVHPHWLPQLVAKVTKLEGMSNKFLRNYIIDYAHNGRVHATINQFRSDAGGTRSHRLSYSDPPLQQMPSRDDEIAPLIRGVFLPEPGEIWGALDYSQQEYRLIVHYAELMDLPKAREAADKYRADPATDFHNLVVEMTGLIRRRAKDVNFAKAYGAGIKKFALMTGMSEDEAAETMRQYDDELPFVKAESETCERLAQTRGYIKLVDGALSHFDDWEPRWRDFNKEGAYLRSGAGVNDVYPCPRDEALARTKNPRHPWFGERVRRADTRKAGNRLIQGSAARQTKLAMRAMWREGIVPLVQMHDELSSSFSDETQAARMAEIMRDVVKLTVPVMVDAEFGVTWGRAAKVKERSGRVVYGATWAEARAEMTPN